MFVVKLFINVGFDFLGCEFYGFCFLLMFKKSTKLFSWPMKCFHQVVLRLGLSGYVEIKAEMIWVLRMEEFPSYS